MLRLIGAIGLIALASACGPAEPAPETTETAKGADAPAMSDEAAADKQKQAEQKAAYEAIKADEAKVDDLADTGNGFALYHRGEARLKSPEYTVQQGGFEDMEAAADAGNADAQLWVGTRMAYGLDGYPLKPNSGLKMIEKAAKQDHVEAILALGLMYEQDTFMRDSEKAKTWYQRGVELGSDKAKEALARLGLPEES